MSNGMELPSIEWVLGLLFNATIVFVLAFTGNMTGFSVVDESVSMKSILIASLFVALYKSALYIAKERGINGTV